MVTSSDSVPDPADSSSVPDPADSSSGDEPLLQIKKRKKIRNKPMASIAKSIRTAVSKKKKRTSNSDDETESEDKQQKRKSAKGNEQIQKKKRKITDSSDHEYEEDDTDDSNTESSSEEVQSKRSVKKKQKLKRHKRRRNDEYDTEETDYEHRRSKKPLKKPTKGKKAITHKLETTETSTSRCSFNAAIHLMELHKSRISEAHRAVLKQTPFHSFFQVFYEGKINRAMTTKSTKSIVQILNRYDPSLSKIKIGSKEFFLTVEDISLIFGLPAKGENIIPVR